MGQGGGTAALPSTARGHLPSLAAARSEETAWEAMRTLGTEVPQAQAPFLPGFREAAIRIPPRSSNRCLVDPAANKEPSGHQEKRSALRPRVCSGLRSCALARSRSYKSGSSRSRAGSGRLNDRSRLPRSSRRNEESKLPPESAPLRPLLKGSSRGRARLFSQSRRIRRQVRDCPSVLQSKTASGSLTAPTREA